jgi:hypothetical protein
LNPAPKGARSKFYTPGNNKTYSLTNDADDINAMLDKLFTEVEKDYYCTQKKYYAENSVKLQRAQEW